MLKANLLPPFKRFCVTIGNLPSSYVDSMSYYECLMWLCKYLKDTVVPTVNENAEAVNELINWFNNLDVQDEINTKLDEMSESGELQEIISEYLNSQAIFSYNTVSDMKSATNLINGSTARTLGYYSVDDNGGALYKIRALTNEDVIDEIKILSMTDETLVAEYIGESINLDQAGCVSNDDSVDNSTKINTACSLFKEVIIPEKTYYISNEIEVNISQCKIHGYSFNSKLVANDFNDEYMMNLITNGTTYLDRHNRGLEIGYFNLVGNSTTNGLLFGDGTHNFECMKFSNIRVDHQHIGFKLNNHNYSNLFEKLDTNYCDYALYTETNMSDSGEALMFENCTFYNGSLYLNRSMQFNGCAIHMLNENTVNTLKFGHYFNNGTYTFNQCHFESLIQNTDIANHEYENVFYADTLANVYINNSEFVISGNSNDTRKQTFKNGFFVSVNDKTLNGMSSINISDSNVTSFLHRLNGASGASICKGNVKLHHLNTKLQAVTYFDTTIFDKTSPLTSGSKKFNSLNNSDLIFITDKTVSNYTLADNVLSLTLAQDTTNIFFVGKLLEVNDNTMLEYYCKLQTDIGSWHMAFNNLGNANNSIIFFDENMNFIEDDVNLRLNVNTQLTANTDYEFKYMMAIPKNCKYVAYGIGGYGLNYVTSVSFTVPNIYCNLI